LLAPRATLSKVAIHVLVDISACPVLSDVELHMSANWWLEAKFDGELAAGS
jgi:hypothetical protein